MQYSVYTTLLKIAAKVKKTGHCHRKRKQFNPVLVSTKKVVQIQKSFLVISLTVGLLRIMQRNSGATDYSDVKL